MRIHVLQFRILSNRRRAAAETHPGVTQVKLNRTLLHVDDDPYILRIVAAKLKSCGYTVVSLSNSNRALENLLEIDARLALIDIDMPGIDGLSLLRDIKRLDGGIQVVMLTGLASTSTTLQAMRWGAEGCVFKPVHDFAPLVAIIEAAFCKIDRWWASLADLKQRKSILHGGHSE